MSADTTRNLRSKINNDAPLLLSKQATAHTLGVCLRTVTTLLQTKQLPCRRIGRRTLIPRQAVIEFARRDHPVVDAKMAAANDR